MYRATIKFYHLEYDQVFFKKIIGVLNDNNPAFINVILFPLFLQTQTC